jgi:predicted nucleotidyltransferase
VNPAVEMVERVARRLGDLNTQVVFVGGAVTGLLITDAAAPPPRPTDDVDAIVEVATRAKYYELANRLRALGFTEDTSEKAPVCRWLVEGIKVDVMPTSEALLGFSNRWYSEALENAGEREISPGINVRVVTAPYFVATKYIATQIAGFLAAPGFPEAVAGHLPGDAASQGRVSLVLARLRALAAVWQP